MFLLLAQAALEYAQVISLSDLPPAVYPAPEMILPDPYGEKRYELGIALYFMDKLVWNALHTD